MKRIRSGDTVIVIAGKSKGKVGKVLRVMGESFVIEGVNLLKKHQKPNPQLNIQGGIISFEGKIHCSNAAIYNHQTKKQDKVGFKFINQNGKNQKVRYFKSNDELIDLAN